MPAKIWLLAAGIVFAAQAEEFSLAVGPPVAAQNPLTKRAVFVFRGKGCSGRMDASAKAEGLAGGARKTVKLEKIVEPQPGVYGVFPEWSGEGVWLVSIIARCDGKTAGALVPIGPAGFDREASKFFSRAATAAEIDAALKDLAGGKKNGPGSD